LSPEAKVVAVPPVTLICCTPQLPAVAPQLVQYKDELDALSAINWGVGPDPAAKRVEGVPPLVGTLITPFAAVQYT
jgi:hypothetical protein